MKYLLLALLLWSASAKGQHLVYDSIPVRKADGSSAGYYAMIMRYVPDTILVVRIISNENRHTWYCHIDNRPFLCKLLEIREYGKPPRYFKKMRRGWGPLPDYYKIWNN